MKLYNPTEKLLPITCVICNISQLPVFWNREWISLLYKGLWLVIFFLCVKAQKGHIYIDKFLLYIVIFFDVFIIIGSMQKPYLSSNLFIPFNMCIFITLVAYMVGLTCNEKMVNTISYMYIFSAFVVAIFVYKDTFSGVDWLNTTAYLYTAKNSVAVIFLVAIVLSYYFIFSVSKIRFIVLTIFFSVLIFMLKSRATIVCWISFVWYISIIKPSKILYKVIAIILSVGVIVLILENKQLYETIVINILFNNRDASNITALTSNRDMHLQEFLRIFPPNMLIGTGGTYLESFPLAVLTSYGLLGAIPVFFLSFYPGIISIRFRKNYSYRKLRSLIIILNILLWVNGLFEEQTPLGPGVKCFSIWMFTGIYLGLVQRRK